VKMDVWGSRSPEFVTPTTAAWAGAATSATASIPRAGTSLIARGRLPKPSHAS